jgi:hypothetical protein
MDDKVKSDWVNKIKLRGWSGAMQTVLDVIEPIAPLASQFLWTLEPMAGLFNADHMVHDLANALDSQEGIEALRQSLIED